MHYEYEMRHKPYADGVGHYANVYEMKVFRITDDMISELVATFEGYSRTDLVHHAEVVHKFTPLDKR